MKFSIARNEESRELVFQGAISFHELADLNLDRLDLALIHDVGADDKATVADYLLALEMIFRRYAEQQAPNA